MSVKIEIIDSLSRVGYIYINSKRDIEDVGTQTLLEDNYRTSNIRTIRCGCNNFTDALFLANKKNKNGYFLSVYPNSPTHNKKCPFYENLENEVKEVAPDSSIFLDAKNDVLLEEERINRFRSLALDMINDSTRRRVNYMFDSNKMEEETLNIFCDYYYELVGNPSFTKKDSVHELCKDIEGFHFTYGIIDSEIDFKAVEKIENNELVNIPFKRIFLNKATNSFEVGEAKNYKITKKKLISSIDNLKKNSAYCTAPYFFNISMIFGEVSRINLTPIYLSKNNKIITFLKNSIEREYVKSLHEKKIRYFNPILNKSRVHVKHYPTFKYLPSLVEVDEDKSSKENLFFKIIEIVNSEKKEVYKETESILFNYFSKRREEENITSFFIVDNESTIWSGLEKIGLGKNKGKTWSELSMKSLLWYSQNLKDSSDRKKAFMEIQRRNSIN
ncbi:hypothetical protein [Poseidonibacter ostreae]|uniref:Uncharacterized protein n=1 Tax=Poseidonibacter ostreae TaxID=2654171 RepID=A0A6L4WWP8_9BACT|nr:hypothetical protein [Poseidonibacter ostreae]KAB7891265.1 hypothetical protein GBG19_00080 [Poseidonibacter ostreae]